MSLMISINAAMEMADWGGSSEPWSQFCVLEIFLTPSFRQKICDSDPKRVCWSTKTCFELVLAIYDDYFNLRKTRDPLEYLTSKYPHFGPYDG